MALIKRADADTHLHRPIALDLGDLARRGELMRDAAAKEAERVLAGARAERDRILQGSAEEGRAAGFAEGHAAGLAEGRQAGHAEAAGETRERLAELAASWERSVAEFEAAREELLSEGRRAVVELAAAIARRVVHRAVELDPTLVLDQVGQMLALVTAPSTMVLRVHPRDEALIAEAMPALRERLASGVHVRLAADESLSRGSCEARMLGGASVDATLETQLERVLADLLPGEPGADR